MLGVFDSGRGGLSALSQLRSILPDADITYLADTQHLPYGNKSAEELIPLIEHAILRLYDHGCERVLIACVTASSLYDRLSVGVQRISYPIIPAIAQAAAHASRGRIGIVATARTVREGILRCALSGRGFCPVSESVGEGLVELVEAERTDEHDAEALSAVWRTLAPHLRARIDTLILGCTHYPLLYNLIDSITEHKLNLIDSGKEAAKVISNKIKDEHICADKNNVGTHTYYVTDEPSGFISLAELFLDKKIKDEVKKATLDDMLMQNV